MGKTLLSELKNFNIDVWKWEGLTKTIYESKFSEIEELKEKIKDPYRKSIIGKHFEQNDIVQRGVEGKLKFYEIGEPIIQRANEIYESRKNDGFKFKRKDILESSECLNSVKQLGGIVDLKDYFKNKSIPSKRTREIGKKILPSGGLFLLSQLGHMLGGATGGYYAFRNLGTPYDVIGGALGFVAGTTLFFLEVFSCENTPEKIIKEPAERFGKDLRWMDETFGRIYRGGGENEK
ncbi:MAG: hypothetical protein ABIH28_01340 [archaeon]